jgi:ATP-dependent DNA helicase RecQ
MTASQALARWFGFDEFRPGQEQAVAAALADRDALVVMPTGAGKSLCYQLPALMRDELTIVVSPLVSLMQDQVSALEQVAPGRVAVVNAQRAGALNAETVQRAVDGRIRLLYVSPERFATRGFLPAISRARVGLFVVDEAHCVSQWGHDFRPDYFALADAARGLGARATIALTATATPRVADDIARRLELRAPVRVTTGFDRPGLSFSVVPCATGVDKRRRLAAALAEPDAVPAIVYAGTRGACEELAPELSVSLGEEALVYHAGLDRGVRARTQERFMDGSARVIVATNAFGMGIDKADVRTVAHASVPGSLEAYYQEAGRAGRDGAPARAVLFAEQRDKALHVYFIKQSQIEDGAFERVGERLVWAGLDGRYSLPLSELAGLAGVGGGTGRPARGRAKGGRVSADAAADIARAIIGHLARAGVVRAEPSAPDLAVGRIVGDWNPLALARCQASAREASRARWDQYRAVWGYVEESGCRRARLLAHFGDRAGRAPSVPCCDVCDPAAAPASPPELSGWGARAARGVGAARGARSARGVSAARGAPAGAAAPAGGDLDGAILEVVGSARPPVGRTRAVEILRGGRSKVIAQHAYDELALYGAFAHLRADDVLGRVDALLAQGSLRSTGGRFPKLRAA